MNKKLTAPHQPAFEAEFFTCLPASEVARPVCRSVGLFEYKVCRRQLQQEQLPYQPRNCCNGTRPISLLLARFPFNAHN